MAEQPKQTGAIAAPQPPPQRLAVHDDSPFSNLLDTGKFEHLWRVAKAFAASELVPEQFRGKVENCWIGIQMAIRCRVDPFMFLQNCYVVHGRPGIESKLAIALLNASGAITGRVRYRLEGEGKSRRCTASVIDRETGQEYSQTVTWAMVEAEGWHNPRGQRGQASKWMTLPDLMFQYRSAMFLIRLHYPDVLMGLQTREEIEDVEEAALPVNNGPTKTDSLVNRIKSLSPLTPAVGADPTGLPVDSPMPSATPVPTPETPATPRPATEAQHAEITAECQRTGTIGEALVGLVRWAGAKRLHDLTGEQADRVLAELRALADADVAAMDEWATT